MKQRLIKIDGKTRTDPKFPTGFMDVVQIEKTGENFRIIYDVKGRFTVHRITASEAAYKLCRARTSGSSTTSRDASPSTGSPPPRPPTHIVTILRNELSLCITPTRYCSKHFGFVVFGFWL